LRFLCAKSTRSAKSLTRAWCSGLCRM
jgi:hypothetical protein